MNNLVSNALKYAHLQTKVTVNLLMQSKLGKRSTFYVSLLVI